MIPPWGPAVLAFGVAAGTWLGWSIHTEAPEPAPVLLWHAVEVPVAVSAPAPAPDPLPILKRVEAIAERIYLDPTERHEVSELPR